ncbi:MAG: hypothetical protein JJ902_23270 [Roseibium sp.]|nr:hypothetical protein [Roseibium sp.]
MTDIETALTATLSAWRRIPFTWADSNCGLRIADYACRLTGIDPAGDWRALGCGKGRTLARVARAGGLEAVLARGLETSGWVRAAPAERGDIILGCLQGQVVSGLHLGAGKAAFSAESGVLITNRFDMRAAWRWRS